MAALLSSLIPDLAKLVTDHLYDMISVVVGFVLALFVTDPIKRWWRGRGKVAEARNAMYQDLAEVYTEILLFNGGMNKAVADKDVNPDAANPAVLIQMMQAFYERIKSHNYDHDLKTLRSLRTSIAAEVRGFENIRALIAGLPSSRVPTMDMTKAVIEFNDKFARAIASEQFDQERLSKAITKVRHEEALRTMKVFSAFLERLRTIIKDAGEREARANQAIDVAVEGANKSIQLRQREAEQGQSLAEDKAEIDERKAG